MFSSRRLIPDNFAGLSLHQLVPITNWCTIAHGTNRRFNKENVPETLIGFSFNSKCSQQLAKNYQQSKIKSIRLT
jgi:hypothetical protein